jgi:hypothetical protein
MVAQTAVNFHLLFQARPPRRVDLDHTIGAIWMVKHSCIVASAEELPGGWYLTNHDRIMRIGAFELEFG